MKSGISVIICCYNSDSRLPETLRYLAHQNIPSTLGVEIIVVNNNSSDNTAEIASTEWEKYNLSYPLRLIEEPNPGLSNARKTGILNANYEYSIFCDDDNWLDKNYIQTAIDLMESNPEIGMLGGQSEAVCEIEPPYWFEYKKGVYAIGKQGIASGDISSRMFLWGASVVLRTVFLRKLFQANIESFLSDRKGNILSSGGDSEISAWFLMAGYKLWYDERLLFKHFIPKERISETYYLNLINGFDESNPILRKYSLIIKYKNNPKIFKKYGNLIIEIIRWLKLEYFNKNKNLSTLTKERIQIRIGYKFKLEKNTYYILQLNEKIINLKYDNN